MSLDASAKLAEKMLQGYAMIQDSCGDCNVPLMRTRDRTKHECVGCGAVFDKDLNRIIAENTADTDAGGHADQNEVVYMKKGEATPGPMVSHGDTKADSRPMISQIPPVPTHVDSTFSATSEAFESQAARSPVRCHSYRGATKNIEGLEKVRKTYIDCLERSVKGNNWNVQRHEELIKASRDITQLMSDIRAEKYCRQLEQVTDKMMRDTTAQNSGQGGANNFAECEKLAKFLSNSVQSEAAGFPRRLEN